MEEEKKKEKSEYVVHAEKFLADTQTTFKADFVRFGKFFSDDEQERAIFKITLKRGERVFSFEFGQSIVNSGFRFPKYTENLNSDLRNNVFSSAWGVEKSEEMFLKHAKLYFHTLKGLEYYKLAFPSAYDVLAGLQKYEVGSFKDFCSEFGYSDDSIKAERVFRSVEKEVAMVRQLWSDEEIEKLQEIN